MGPSTQARAVTTRRRVPACSVTLSTVRVHPCALSARPPARIYPDTAPPPPTRLLRTQHRSIDIRLSKSVASVRRAVLLIRHLHKGVDLGHVHVKRLVGLHHDSVARLRHANRTPSRAVNRPLGRCADVARRGLSVGACVLLFCITWPSTTISSGASSRTWRTYLPRHQRNVSREAGGARRLVRARASYCMPWSTLGCESQNL